MAPTLYRQAVTVGAISTGALILFYSKNRYGATPGRAFPHLAYVGTREMPFCNLCARERRYFRGENCYVTPPDGLTAGTLRVFGLRGFTSRGIYRTSSVSLQTKINSETRGVNADRNEGLEF